MNAPFREYSAASLSLEREREEKRWPQWKRNFHRFIGALIGRKRFLQSSAECEFPWLPLAAHVPSGPRPQRSPSPAAPEAMRQRVAFLFEWRIWSCLIFHFNFLFPISAGRPRQPGDDERAHFVPFVMSHVAK